MKKDITKLVTHIEKHPNDSNALISLLKIKGENILYDYELISKKKREKMLALKRKKGKSND